MLIHQTVAQVFDIDRRIHDGDEPWIVGPQNEDDVCILDSNKGLALGDFICKIYRPLGKDIVIQKYLEQCVIYRERPNILRGMRNSILTYLEVNKNQERHQDV